MTLVSVVIPCRNAEPWLRDTLRSVLLQEMPDLETIVVDDGSEDGSPALVEREFPAVHLVRSARLGPSGARNVGTRLSTGQFIQYLDADDLLAPRKLERQINALHASGAEVAYGDWRELRQDADGGSVPGRAIRRRITGDPEIALFTDFWCPPAAYLFRRTIVEHVGAWNEDLPIIQDARFVLDCALHGARFVYCPGEAAYYRVHAGGSVSTRDPCAFTRDCFHNALQVEQRWTNKGQLTAPRQEALVRVYGQVARTSYGAMPEVFEAAYAAMERLQPGYRPSRPWRIAVASRVLGYRRAEAVAWRYRSAKRALDPVPGQRHARIRHLARLACKIPGVQGTVRGALRATIQHSSLRWHTKQRLHNLLAEDIAPRGFAVCNVQVPGSAPLRLSVQVRDDLSRYWYYWGYEHYERGTIRLLRMLLRNTRCFFDVGANVGYFSLFAARVLDGRGEVHAFEPWAECYADLARNAEQNRLSNLHLVRAALADEDCMTKLFIPGDREWTTASFSADFARSNTFETVASMRFESYCRARDLALVDLVKIDVEGAELRVLRGMGQLLNAWRPNLIVEVLPPFEKELDDFFANTAYRKYRIRTDGLEAIDRMSSVAHERNVFLTCATLDGLGG